MTDPVDDLNAELFWAEAEQGKQWFDGLPQAERRRLFDEDEVISSSFRGI